MTDDTKESLADITLRWMVREVALAQCGIAFDEAALARANIPDSVFQLPPPPVGDAPASGVGDPQDEDPDALQPIHDELQIDKLWWLLEILPLTHDVCTDGKWQTKWWYVLSLFVSITWVEVLTGWAQDTPRTREAAPRRSEVPCFRPRALTGRQPEVYPEGHMDRRDGDVG